MNKTLAVVAILAIAAIEIVVGNMDYPEKVENHLWDVQCGSYIHTYEAPERLSIQKEIEMCK